MNMKTCILGSGALGSAIGGVLAAAGADICLVDSRKEHIDAMNARGLTLEEGGEPSRIPVKAATNMVGLGTVDLLVVAVKSFDTKRAMEDARSAIGPGTTVLSLQDGLGNEEAIAAVVGADRVVYGKTYIGAGLEEPGRVFADIRGKLTLIGEADGVFTDRARRIAEEWNDAGIETELSSNVLGVVWDKLLVDVATGALSAITRMAYGGLYQVEQVEACAAAAIAEAVSVADALGIALDTENPAEIWRRASVGLSADFKTSMLRGIECGERSEIDVINGAIVRYGERACVPTPVNRTLVACMKGIESGLGIR